MNDYTVPDRQLDPPDLEPDEDIPGRPPTCWDIQNIKPVNNTTGRNQCPVEKCLWHENNDGFDPETYPDSYENPLKECPCQTGFSKLVYVGVEEDIDVTEIMFVFETKAQAQEWVLYGVTHGWTRKYYEMEVIGG